MNYSERTMSGFYSRWNANEKKLQAYIDLPNYEKVLKDMNDKGAPPAVISITVPYSYATIWTIVTYLIHTFCGQRPMFKTNPIKAESVEAAMYMETLLQFNADHTKLTQRLIQWFLDGETYGVGVVRNLWTETKANRTVFTEQPIGGLLTPNAPTQLMRQRQNKTVYEGNSVTNIDPFMFFPDPRVPMSEVNSRGEFVFWRSFEGKHALLREQANGTLQYIGSISAQATGTNAEAGQSQRSLLAKGDSHAGALRQQQGFGATDNIQIDQCSIEIVPKELGLGEETVPQKWLFSIANKTQIVQAEPLDMDHGRHPVSVIEPSSLGYAFGQPGTMDFLAPVQDTLSWFINSHIYNVRSALNNMFVVDPSMLELQDLKNPEPGKIIRLKQAAYGQDVRTALQQLQVQDVTSNHINSMEMFLRIGDSLSAVNDNLRGIQDSGGRKTATEVRTSGEAGASRLAARARYISSQGMTDLAEQMSLNIQQFMSMEFYLEVVGQKGLQHPVTITPQMVAGDFTFPVSDGTLPIDKVAMLGVWKDIWMAINQSPGLSQRYNAEKIFEYMAELGGVKNLGQFKVEANVVPDETAANRSPDALPLGSPVGGVPGFAPLG
ncbi:MAG: hypothetical protein E6R03_15500 [Hyphomicrobiaceae bacterium]|nr:MAG: hypothetical protein E6R03_15500 [Hyphomicrobiaceae bacterium]